MSINNIAYYLERINKTLQQIAKSLDALSQSKKKQPAASLPAGDNEKEEGDS